MVHSTKNLKTDVIRLCRAHFVYVGIFAGLIILSDAWNLITPQVVLHRWVVAAIMLAVVTTVWYAARTKASTGNLYAWLIYTLVILDVAVASYMVYTSRGIASRAVALFAIPIVSAAALKSRVAPFAAAALATAGYTLAGIGYFINYPGEAYKVELYAELAFYCASFFILAGLLWTVNRAHK